MNKTKRSEIPTVLKAVRACLAAMQVAKRSKREYESALLGAAEITIGREAAGPALGRSHLATLRVDRLTAELLAQWFNQRFPEHLAKSTRKKGMIGLRHFVKYCISQGWADQSLLAACPSMPSSKPRREWLHPEVVVAFSRVAKDVLDEWRYFAWFVLLSTGVRVEEIGRLRRSDLNARTKTLTVTGKGDKTREVPVDDEFIEAWNEHVKRYGIAPNGWMFFFRAPRFVAQSGAYEWVVDKRRHCGPKPFQRICEIVQTAAEAELVPDLLPNFKVTPHVLRRTYCCIQLIQNVLGLGGMDLVSLQGAMGHESLDTTRGYLGDVDSYLKTMRRDVNTVDAAAEIVRYRAEQQAEKGAA
jgi:integrase